MKPRVRIYARVLISVVLAMSLLLQLVWVAVNVGDLRDYGSFIAAGKAVEDGDNPYGVYEDTYRTTYANFELDLPNLNPPISVYAFQALAAVDPATGKAVLNAASVLLYAAVIVALVRRYPDKRTPLVLLWALSLAGFWHVIELGQVYVPLLAAVTAAWLLQERQPLLAGVLVGLAIALKPNFAVWPLLLLLSGERRTSLSALGTAAGISAIPLLLDGPQIYRHWLEASTDFGGIEMPGNSAIVAIFARAGLDALGWAASALLVGALAVYALKARASKQELAAAGIVGALLLGPITWSGYSLFALPVLMARPWGGWERASAAFLAFPVFVLLALMPMNGVTWFIVGPVYGWGLLILLGLLGNDAVARVRQPQDVIGSELAEDQRTLAA
jgi:hypothetical protein